MAHAQKPDFVFRRNGRVYLNRQGGRQFSRLLAAEVCASTLIVGSNAEYTMFRGSEKSTGYPLHSPVSPSLPHTCVTVYHHISTGVCHSNTGIVGSNRAPYLSVFVSMLPCDETTSRTAVQGVLQISTRKNTEKTRLCWKDETNHIIDAGRNGGYCRKRKSVTATAATLL
jgi:hypothetical protein